MFIIYGSYVEGYLSLIKSMETAFQVMLGKFDLSQYSIGNQILGKLVFSVYNIVIICFALNIFISIIVESFGKIRYDSKKNPNTLNFWNHLCSKLKKNSDESTFLSYRDHLSLLPARVDSLIGYVIRVNNVEFF